MVVTHGEVHHLVTDGFLYTQDEWVVRLPVLQDECLARLVGILETIDGPNVQEEYEKSFDKFCLVHLIHHERVGLRNQAGESNLATLLRKHTCD